MATINIEEVCPRLPGESDKAYQAFVDSALNNISQRELLAEYERQTVSNQLAKVPTLKYGVIAKWSKVFKWQERLKVWRSHFNRYKAEQRFERWDVFCDEMEIRVKALIDRADLLMQHSHIEKKVVETVVAKYAGEEIEQTVIIKPYHWTGKDVVGYYSEASRLMNMVVGNVPIAINLLTSLGYIVSDPSFEAVDSDTQIQGEDSEAWEALEEDEPVFSEPIETEL